MTFRIVSYNILADAYIRPEYFPATPRRVLDPAWREPALLKRSMDLDADVLCLQEVEETRWRVLRRELEARGYEGHYGQKRAGKPDGCATFVRRPLRVRDVETLAYCDGENRRPDSGHVALVVVLEAEGRMLGVANTHLKWARGGTPPGDHPGVRQAIELARRLERRSTPPCEAWIVCGDLNATADSEVLAPLQGAGLRDAYGEHSRAFTCNANQAAKRIDFVLHSDALTARPLALATIADDTPLPSDHEPSDHLPIGAALEWALGSERPV